MRTNGRQRVVAVAVLIAGCVAVPALRAQEKQEKQESECGSAARPVRTYPLKQVTDQREGDEIRVALISVSPARVAYSPLAATISVCGTPEQQEMAAKLIAEMDLPHKTYRLTYTMTEMDEGKRAGTQHYTMLVASGQRSQVKVGSKVPVMTGAFSSGGTASGTQTQFQYIDVGMNFDATFTETSGGGLLKTKVESSSGEQDKEIGGVREPVLRQLTFEGSPMLVLGKPAMLGTMDLPGSTRNVEIEVMVEEVK